MRKARAYLEQAFEFYAAAENPQRASRPLLYYYSFLNLAKVFLIDRGVNFPPLVRHGIRDPRTNLRAKLRLEGQRVKLEPRASNRSEIFPEFADLLGGASSAGDEFRVIDLLSQVPAIHRAYVEVVGKPPSFLAIKRFDALTDARHVWIRCVFDKSRSDVRQILRRMKRQRGFRRIFTHVNSSVSDEAWFETRAILGRRRGVDPALVQHANDLRGMGIWSVLAEQGYRYYLGTFRPARQLPQLATIYAIMFYLGSITRYKPYDFDRIVHGRYGWLVGEFLATQPQQFLYLLASTMVGRDVVRPWAIM